MALDGDEPGVVLRWIGDPSDPHHTFWSQVSPIAPVAAPVPGDASRTCYSMPLGDLLVALRQARRAALNARAAREHAAGQAGRKAVFAELDRRERAKVELLEEITEGRLQRLDDERLADNADDEREGDEQEPGDHEASSAVYDDDMDEAQREEEDAASQESPYDDDDDLEREASDAQESSNDDPVASLLGRARGVLHAIAAADASAKARPAEILELADALERRGCPRDAAWQLAKGQLELRAALDAADREPVSDLSGSMIHVWKGIEVLLADRFARPLKQMRDRRLLELKGYLDSLGAFAAALAQVVVRLHGRWPSEVPGFVDPRDREDSGIRVRPGGQPEPVLSNAIRLAWTATCVRFVAVVLRNGYTHKHRAGRVAAERLLRVALGEGGLVDFLLRHNESAPSEWLRHEVQGAGTPANESDPTIALTATELYGVIADGRLYRMHELQPACAPGPESAIQREDDEEPAPQPASTGATTREAYPSEEIYHPDDVGLEKGFGQVACARWPAVQVQAILTTSGGGPRTVDLGLLTPKRSTLVWRCVPARVQVVWGLPAALSAPGRTTVRLTLRPTASPRGETGTRMAGPAAPRIASSSSHEIELEPENDG